MTGADPDATPALDPTSASDLIARLRTPLTYVTVDGVDVASHPSGPIDDLLEEAADLIEALRSVLNAGTIAGKEIW